MDLMARNSAAVLIISIFAALPGVFVIRAQKPAPSAEQTYFEEGAELQNPETISPAALKVLLESKEGAAAQDDAEDEHKDPSAYFRAASVHLSTPDQVDFVVGGVCPLCGADNGWFWIVRSGRQNPKVILFANGNSIKILDTKSDGYRDIRSSWSSPQETLTTIYHYNGQRYQVWQKRRTQNRN